MTKEGRKKIKRKVKREERGREEGRGRKDRREGRREESEGKLLPLTSWLIMVKNINLSGCQFFSVVKCESLSRTILFLQIYL